MSSATLARFAEQLEQYRYRPTAFCRDILGFDPHEGQANWLRNSTATENALVTGNRWGKSSIAAAKRIWRCAFRKGWGAELAARMDADLEPYHAINVSITADQARLVWFKAHAMLQRKKSSWMVRDVKMTPFPRIEFVNGAILEARSTGNSGERLLGNVYDDVNWDEAAYEKRFEYVRDNVMRMRVVDRAGIIDYTSTGNGRNEFGRYFLEGLPGAKRDVDLYSQTGTSFENPNIDHERLRKNADRMSMRMRQQNIEGLIVDAGGGFFDIVDIEACVSEQLTDQLVIHLFDDQEQPMHAEVYCPQTESGLYVAGDGIPWHSRYPTHRYLHFWDVADKADWCVGRTLDTSGDRMKEVEFERFQHQGWAYIYERIRDRHNRYTIGNIDGAGYEQSQTFVDQTGVGDVVVENLTDIGAQGFVFSKKSKDEILGSLQSAMSLREIEYPMIPVAYDELKFYERADKNLVQDTVMALAGAVHFGRRRPFVYAAEV